MLGDLLCNQPSRLRAQGSRVVLQFEPAEVSDIPDERLFVVMTFAATSFVMRFQSGDPAPYVFQLYADTVTEYREWDPEGMPLVTREGLDRAWDQVNDIVLH